MRLKEEVSEEIASRPLQTGHFTRLARRASPGTCVSPWHSHFPNRLLHQARVSLQRGQDDSGVPDHGAALGGHPSSMARRLMGGETAQAALTLPSEHCGFPVPVGAPSDDRVAIESAPPPRAPTRPDAEATRLRRDDWQGLDPEPSPTPPATSEVVSSTRLPQLQPTPPEPPGSVGPPWC